MKLKMEFFRREFLVWSPDLFTEGEGLKVSTSVSSWAVFVWTSSFS